MIPLYIYIDSSRINNRFDMNKKDDAQTINNNNNKYSYDRDSQGNDDTECADTECRHHARCRKLSDTNATTMVQCYCPTTCNELLKTISIHHINDAEGFFNENNNLTTTIKRSGSYVSHKANNQMENANSKYSIYNNNDGDDDSRDKNATTLRDIKQSKSDKQPKSASVATVDPSAKLISPSSSDNGATPHSIQYPLCGTDGNDYSTLCQLLNASCIHQMDIRVKSIGSCSKFHVNLSILFYCIYR